MPKNIVILCDGTSNEIAEDRTNILRLYGTLQKNDRQLVFYDPGVGTFGAANAWSRTYRKSVEIGGLATGWGLDQNVKQAYEFLVRNYDDGKRPGSEPNENPDQIYLFGFSRGAYTARVLAGFIHSVGLIEATNLNLLDYAYRAYKSVGELTSGADEAAEPFAEVRLYERILRPRRPAIRCLGLFDTVASVLEPGRTVVPRFRSHAYTKTNQSVEAVRHAVAIDERRRWFQAQLWPAGGEYWLNRFPKKPEHRTTQDTKEVWFAGCHGDVGGGHRELDSRLAKVPLIWMIEETKALGLRYSTRTVNNLVLAKYQNSGYVPPDPETSQHETLTGFWPALEYLPRRLPPERRGERANLGGFTFSKPERRRIPSGAALHQSAFDHYQAHGGTVPGNVPDNHTVTDYGSLWSPGDDAEEEEPSEQEARKAG